MIVEAETKLGYFNSVFKSYLPDYVWYFFIQHLERRFGHNNNSTKQKSMCFTFPLDDTVLLPSGSSEKSVSEEKRVSVSLVGGQKNRCWTPVHTNASSNEYTSEALRLATYWGKGNSDGISGAAIISVTSSGQTQLMIDLRSQRTGEGRMWPAIQKGHFKRTVLLLSLSTFNIGHIVDINLYLPFPSYKLLYFV